MDGLVDRWTADVLGTGSWRADRVGARRRLDRFTPALWLSERTLEFFSLVSLPRLRPLVTCEPGWAAECTNSGWCTVLGCVFSFLHSALLDLPSKPSTGWGLGRGAGSQWGTRQRQVSSHGL